MNVRLLRVARSVVSYIPSSSLLFLRRLEDWRTPRTPHEPEYRVLQHLAPRSHVFLDVGANRGQSIRSIRLVVDDVEIIAVEPNPHLAAALQWTGAEVHPVALATETGGTLTLFLPRYGHTVYDTRASLRDDQAQHFLAAEFFARFDSRRAAVETVTVPVCTVDDLATHPTIMKIDVEGNDHPVVAGGMQTIREARPLILIEQPATATFDLLLEIGYRPFRFDGDRLIGDDRTAVNVMFLTPEHEDDLRQGGLDVG